MNDTPTQTAITPFWRFSLKFYGQSGVSDACIALQDGCGIDVNLLLFLFWLASERQALSPDEDKKLDSPSESWCGPSISPRRDMRTQIHVHQTVCRSAQEVV